ncbi:hypothetical protein Tco_1090974 [Tanacetum coccineum]|uniref:Uncharacterized protein n=1 Tax=Tanacetum coccineum TaxID=301880 RepID=A0ABQ5I6U2_9ASTR
MAGERGSNSVVDDLSFSFSLFSAKWNEVGQLNALIAELEASEDVGEVWDTIMCLRDEQCKAEAKLADLQYWLTVA